MKRPHIQLKSLAVVLGAASLLPFESIAGATAPVGEDAVPVGEDAVPVGEGAVPVGEGAVPVGEGAVPVGEGAVPVGEGAVPVGEGAVPVGEGAVPVGEGAVPVGEGAVPVGEGAVPVGEGAVPVGEGAVPVGEGAVPVGEGAVPVGEGAVPVGEDAVPVGEDAVSATHYLGKIRLKNRAASAAHPSTRHLFGSAAVESRLAKAEARLEEAIKKPIKLSPAMLEKRAKQNADWSKGALASASSRPGGLLNAAWWTKHAGSGKLGSYAASSAAKNGLGGATWAELSQAVGLPSGTEPFIYRYDENLTFKNDVIYVNAQAISSYDDFVLSAGNLAKSAAKGSSPAATWTPLGTFALSTSLGGKKVPHAIQLGIDGSGNLGGAYVNWMNGTVAAIHGKLDTKTQRVAFNVGTRENLTMETGLANLSGDTVRLWVHLPNKHSQTWLLARLKP